MMKFDDTFRDAIQTLKTQYLAIKAERDAARGQMGDRLGKAKALDRLIKGRPDTKNGSARVPLTGAEKAQAERERDALRAEAREFKDDAKILTNRMRLRLMAYGFSRNRTYDRMEPNCKDPVWNDKAIDLHLSQAGLRVPQGTINDWLKGRTCSPYDLLGVEKMKQRVGEAEARLDAA